MEDYSLSVKRVRSRGEIVEIEELIRTIDNRAEIYETGYGFDGDDGRQLCWLFLIGE